MEKPTIVIRHRRENLKKCSLKGLEARADFLFFTYPDCVQKKEELPPLDEYVVLDLEGEPLSPRDVHKGLILIDATWRLAATMSREIKSLHALPKRSIPGGYVTAYPRRQLDCKNPEAGLASIEALYVAFKAMGKEADMLLNEYYWKEAFLEKNSQIYPNLG
jgi:pre-rRNA-processing protein TSR3